MRVRLLRRHCRMSMADDWADFDGTGMVPVKPLKEFMGNLIAALRLLVSVFR